MHSRYGATAGKMVFKLKLARADGQPLTQAVIIRRRPPIQGVRAGRPGRRAGPGRFSMGTWLLAAVTLLDGVFLLVDQVNPESLPRPVRRHGGAQDRGEPDLRVTGAWVAGGVAGASDPGHPVRCLWPSSRPSFLPWRSRRSTKSGGPPPARARSGSRSASRPWRGLQGGHRLTGQGGCDGALQLANSARALAYAASRSASCAVLGHGEQLDHPAPEARSSGERPASRIRSAASLAACQARQARSTARRKRRGVLRGRQLVGVQRLRLGERVHEALGGRHRDVGQRGQLQHRERVTLVLAYSRAAWSNRRLAARQSARQSDAAEARQVLRCSEPARVWHTRPPPPGSPAARFTLTNTAANSAQQEPPGAPWRRRPPRSSRRPGSVPR